MTFANPHNYSLPAAALLALCLTMASPGARAEKIVSAETPAVIADIASGFGSAVLETDDIGDPMISGRINGYKYVIYFYGCEDNKDCKDVQFMAAWSDTHATAAHMHEWNEGNRFGTAFLDDEGDPTIQMAVNLAYGVTHDNFDDTVDWWRVVMTDFAKFVLEKEPGDGDGRPERSSSRPGGSIDQPPAETI